jgi:hypothetical protein
MRIGGLKPESRVAIFRYVSLAFTIVGFDMCVSSFLAQAAQATLM